MKKLMTLLLLVSLFSCGKHTLIKGDESAGALGVQKIVNSDELIIATNQGNFGRVKTLLAEGENPNSLDEKGFSLLMIASRKNDFVIVDLLIKSGADTEYENEKGEKAIDLASKDFTKKLIEDNTSVLESDWEDYLLQVVKEASQKNEKEKIVEIELLLDFGVSPNTADTRASILMYACSKGLVETVKFLLRNDELDINMVMGRAPRLYTALDRTRDKVVKEILMEHGAVSAKDL
jgi:ankyrin repeat protein